MFTKYHDPLEVLPIEIVEIIFGMLSMQDLLTCLSLSKSWKYLMKSMTNVFTTMIANDEYQPITLDILKSYLSLSNYSVNCALLDLKFFKNEYNARFLMETCQKLQELRISGEGEFTSQNAASLVHTSGIKKLHFSPEIEMSLRTMTTSLKACQSTIEEARFARLTSNYHGTKHEWPEMNSLTSIYLSSCGSCELELSGLIVGAPNLRKIVIYKGRSWDGSSLDMRHWSQLETVEFRKTYFVNFPILPPSLKHLTIEKKSGFTLMSNGDYGNYSFPLLETLSSQNMKIDVSTLWEITKSSIQANKLKTLICGKLVLDTPSDTPINYYFPPSSTLEELSLELAPINDEDVHAIIKLYPNLKKINLSQTRVTHVSIQELVKAGVKSINLDGCLKVHTRFVAMAREQGVNVSMKVMNDLFPLGDHLVKQVSY